MRKTIVILVFFFAIICHAQIKVEISPLKIEDKNNVNFNIIITNYSNSDYIIPLDQSLFQGYYPKEFCNDLESLENFVNLGFNVIVKESDSNILLRPSVSNIEIERSELALQRRKAINDSLKEIHYKGISQWQKKYRIKNLDFSEKNMVLTKSIISIKAQEKIVLNKTIDLSEIKNNLFSQVYDRYILQIEKKYKMSLALCISNNIYKYLTTEQKKKFKSSKLFSGKLYSNEVELK